MTPIGGVGGLAGAGEPGGLTCADHAGGKTAGLERSTTVGMADVSCVLIEFGAHGSLEDTGTDGETSVLNKCW